ncbi:hypothetical protein MTR_3g080900 [Medicago truncatula]|uniref:Uncharacterized protein n=1 Tax=Medicago truncatula TaxID=3880 RepID=G7J809_MEDTR|nr:hypothetical protein MTR_3g080900 [Medicago truncatula]
MQETNNRLLLIVITIVLPTVGLSSSKFDTIRITTDNFSNANKHGQAGFGPAYKRLYKNSAKGDIEFKRPHNITIFILSS